MNLTSGQTHPVATSEAANQSAFDKPGGENILVTGASAHRSEVIADLAQQLAEAGKPMVFVDSSGAYTEKFYRPGVDVMFAPTHPQFPGWQVFNDVQSHRDAELFAASSLQLGYHENDQAPAIAVARTVLASILRKLLDENQANQAALHRALFDTPKPALREMLAGYRGARFLDADNRFGIGALGTLSVATSFLSRIPAGEFSIKAFLKEPGDRRLFIPAGPKNMGTFRGVASTVLGIAYAELSCGMTFILDDAAAVGHISSLPVGLVTSKAAGSSTILGVSHGGRFDELYGAADASSIRASVRKLGGGFYPLASTPEPKPPVVHGAAVVDAVEMA